MKSITYIYIVVVTMSVFTFDVTADTISIMNEISATASSGGQHAGADEVVYGTTHTEVFVETIVNGEVVELIDEYVSDSDDPLEIARSYESDDGSVVVETSVSVNTDTADVIATSSLGDTVPSITSLWDRLEKIKAGMDQLFRDQKRAGDKEVKNRTGTLSQPGNNVEISDIENIDNKLIQESLDIEDEIAAVASTTNQNRIQKSFSIIRPIINFFTYVFTFQWL